MFRCSKYVQRILDIVVMGMLVLDTGLPIRKPVTMEALLMEMAVQVFVNMSVLSVPLRLIQIQPIVDKLQYLLFDLLEIVIHDG